MKNHKFLAQDNIRLTDTQTVFSHSLIGKVVRVEGHDQDGDYLNKIGMVHEVEPAILELRLITGDLIRLKLTDFLDADDEIGFQLYVFSEERRVNI